MSSQYLMTGAMTVAAVSETCAGLTRWYVPGSGLEGGGDRRGTESEGGRHSECASDGRRREGNSPPGWLAGCPWLAGESGCSLTTILVGPLTVRAVVLQTTAMCAPLTSGRWTDRR